MTSLSTWHRQSCQSCKQCQVAQKILASGRQVEAFSTRTSMRYFFILIFIMFILAGCSDDRVVTSIDLYFMEVTETEFKLASETRNFDGPQPGIMPVMKAWLEGPQAPKLNRVVPEDVRLINGFILDGVAYLDFSSEITKAAMGSELEAVLVESIALTAAQVKGVKSVQIMVEGEIIESLAGHMLINKPIKIDI